MKSTLRSKTGFVGLISLLLALPCSVSLAQPPITPSGLNTQVNLAPAPPPRKVQYDITGGTRPGNGLNLFHSFGNFNLPTNNIANFLNDSGLPTSNILGRVTGGNISNIFGTIQTTGFGNANPIGLSIVALDSVVGGVLHVQNVDILDGTPLLDIKPYVTEFDSHTDIRTGWLEEARKTVATRR